MCTVSLLLLFLPGLVFAGSHRCRVFEELADPKHLSDPYLKRVVEEKCHTGPCSLDQAESIFEQMKKPRKDPGHFNGHDAHYRENEEALSVVRQLRLNRDQQRRLHDEISRQDLTRTQILETARDLFDH